MSSDFRVNPARHSALLTNNIGQVHILPSPNGLSSTPTTLAPSIRHQAKNFFQNWCDDCCGLLKRLVQRLFPCLFPNQNQEVATPEGPISAEVLNQRVFKIFNYLDQQLRRRVDQYARNPDEEWEPRGIENELIYNNSKVVVLLEYNGMKDFCYAQLNGPPSLEALKIVARQKLTDMIDHPNNRQAHIAGLSITTCTYYLPRLYIGTPCHQLNHQNRTVTLNPDNTLSYHPTAPGGIDSLSSRATHDQTRAFFQERVATLQGRQELERFLF
jgi:hypothetical protein